MAQGLAKMHVYKENVIDMGIFLFASFIVEVYEKVFCESLIKLRKK